MIQAIFFDLFETLITEWENGKKKASYTNDLERIAPEIFKQEWSARREERMDGTFPNFHAVVEDILTSRDLPVNWTEIESLYQKRVKSKLVPFETILPEIITTLERIKSLGIKIGLISNCTPEEVIAWDSSPFSKLFDDVIFSFQVKLAKPNPEIYLSACKNLHVKPDCSLFVGDGGSNELQGAAEAGMEAYHATWFQPLWISEKIREYPKLAKPDQLIEIIKNDRS